MQVCDLALLTVEDEAFWLGASGDSPLQQLNFVDVPERECVSAQPCGRPRA